MRERDEKPRLLRRVADRLAALGVQFPGLGKLTLDQLYASYVQGTVKGADDALGKPPRPREAR